jgi:hypothetical protein
MLKERGAWSLLEAATSRKMGNAFDHLIAKIPHVLSKISSQLLLVACLRLLMAGREDIISNKIHEVGKELGNSLLDLKLLCPLRLLT